MEKFYEIYRLEIKNDKKNKSDALIHCIIDAIENSIIMVGDVVPTQRPFADEVGIGVNCVSRAFVRLKKRGYITTDLITKKSFFTDRNSSFAASKSMFSEVAHPTFMSKLKKIFPWKSKKYLDIGRTAINPSLVVQAKPNPIQKIIHKIFDNGIYYWNTYLDNNRKFIKHALFEVVSQRHSNINIDQIALGVSRGAVLTDLARIFIEPGEGVVLNSKADRQVREKFEAEGAHLFFLTEEHGICLNELVDIVERQKNTENPIKYVFTNPFHDNFCDDENIYQNIYKLIYKTQDLDICMILEFGQDAFLKQPIDYLIENKLVNFKHVLSIKKFSKLTAEMNEIQLIMGPTDLIKIYERKKFNKVHNKGLIFFLMEEIKGKLVVEDFLPDIVSKLDKWRKEIEVSAEVLSPWFSVKKATKGACIWLVSNEGKELMVPMNLLIELNLAVTHSWEDYEDEFPIEAIRVGFGYGETVEINKAFLVIREYLLIHYPLI